MLSSTSFDNCIHSANRHPKQEIDWLHAVAITHVNSNFLAVTLGKVERKSENNFNTVILAQSFLKIVIYCKQMLFV